MKRFTGVLLVLAVFGAGYLYGACSRGYGSGSGGGGEGVAYAQVITATSGTELIEPKWYEDFDMAVDEQRVLNKDTNVYDDNAHAVPLCWLLTVVLRNIDKEEKNLIFVVTDADGRIIPAGEYKIFIRGYKSGGDLSWAQDFPPILYP